ncbi:23S rRNA (uracil-C(5))-methyltransferase RlmCD [Oxobacter pfennigii]|uniref:23S rRNA (Uracil-C(5))-methyltransferase RlmCD n=1 Tax=Oxobacter pfennigii TaxID=36849 RepID=A0A0P8WLU7_9CLOT|nr:23S rRNA (uracil(1939)-C(5))-methyltransferase RlmD [Oxobacter pfennigii]KPU43454.1 23S rRNA (uracil-C(5))-methyltransferase RlmCD [Oxobacter pfennigii]
MVNAAVEKNKDYIIKIDNLGYEGEGVGRINNFTVFVPGALPGEEAEIKIVKVNKNFAFGKLNKIIKQSSDRTEPMCTLKRCGGCQLMHLSYEAQLKFKKQRVIDSIERIAKLKDVIIYDTIGMENPYRYRNKAQFPISVQNGKPVAGFYAPRSHEIIDTLSCLIQDEVSDKVMDIIKKWAFYNDISIYDEAAGKGLLRHIMVRKALRTGEVMVAVIINGYDIPHKDKLIAMLKEQVESLKSVVLNINREVTNVVLGQETKVLYGSPTITDYIGDLKFNISPLSFFQVNPIQTEVLYSKALEYANLTGEETVIDAYCGTGTISLFLARKAKKVYGVEIVEPAIENAKKNARENNISNVEFIVGKSEEVIPELYKQGIKADVIVVDPPRKGCDEALLKTIAAMAPKTVVYVSCDPGTLARDLKYLEENGFKVKEIQPVDMFPVTSHVETVVCLSRKNPDDRIEIDLSLDELDITTAESKATYEEIKDYVLKNHSMKVSSLYISQVKRKLGLEIGTSYNLPKSEDARVPQCPLNKEKAITEALNHFSMI